MSAESTNPTMLFLDRNAPLRVKNTNELRYDSKRSYTSNELTLETPSFNLQAQLIYKLSEQWSSQTVLSRSHSRSKGYSYLYETTQYIPAITDGVVFWRYFNHQNATSLTTDIQQNFIGDFKIGNCATASWAASIISTAPIPTMARITWLTVLFISGMTL
jgi:iron complex outermembrane receptor protein